MSDPVQNRLKDKLTILKEAWDKQWQRNESLDNKASSTIQVAGTITALIFGFVTFSQSTTEFDFGMPIQIAIIVSIFTGLGSIILSILALRTRNFFFPIDPDKYLTDPKLKLGKNFDPDAVSFNDENVRESYDYESLFKYYVISLKTFLVNSKSKARFVFAAIILLVTSVALTVAVVVAIFWEQSLPSETAEGQLACTELDTSATRVMNTNNIIESSFNKNSKVMLCIGN